MRKSVIVCCALMLACSSAAVLTACGGDNAQEMFATYETWQDGFYNINMMDGFGRISRSDEQAHGGEYSAKLQPLGSHTDGEAPYFYYPMQIEGGGGYNYTDFSRLDNISFWMYNAESEEVTFELCIVASVADVYGTDCKTVQEVTLAPAQWTQVTYKPDYEALQNMCDITNVAGFAFRFANQNSSDIADAPVLYLDDLAFSVSEEPLAEIKTSTPARGEIQSFDLASSMVYVRLQSGLDYSESYLAAGSDKLPAGAKGGIEFTVTDAEMGTWPRLHFDSRTPQTELQDADRFSLMLYFGTSDPAVTEAELHMFPDTSSEYVEYVKTNEWVKVTIDSETMLNNWGDSVGVRSLGLFWLQNGGTSCFNAIDVVRVADIRAEFDEVRVPDLADGSVGTAYTLPEATLEIDGTPVAAESWSYAVSYKNASLCGDEYPAIALDGRTFTPSTGGTFVATYTATYQGKTYTASKEFTVARAAAAAGELESFDDPAVLDSIRMNSGTGVEYTSPEYLWEGSDKLPEGAKGGVEYTIPDVTGGTWPRFYFTSRASSAQIAAYDTVSFDIYLDAPGHNGAILVKMYPETTAESDKWIMPNEWQTITLDASQFADVVSRVSPDGTGLFWVQNGERETGKVNTIDHIRIANIRAYNAEDVRDPAAENEIENFGDVNSLMNVNVSSAALRYDNTDKAAVASFATDVDLWLNVSVKARRSLSEYQALKEDGYNAVTLELYLEAADGSDARNAQMQYWVNPNGIDFGTSQASVAIGEWVTLTLDLDTYLKALESSSDGSVTLFWVASSVRGNTNARLSELRIRNVQLAKATDVVNFGTGAEDFFLLDSPENPASYAYYESGSEEIPANVPEAVKANGAVCMSLAAGAESWPHIKLSADRNMFADGNTVTITLYIRSSSESPLSIRQWAHGSDYVVKGELPVNQWVEFKVDAEVLRTVFNWSITDGIEYTDLLWFTNAGGNTVSEVWIAGVRVSQEETAEFSNTGIAMENSFATTEEDGDHLNAWFGIVSKNGYAYKLTIKKGETVLEKGTDYTVSDQDASVTLIDPEAGEYTFCFESYGNRFTSGTLTVTVTAKAYSVEIGNAQEVFVGEAYTLPSAQLMSDGAACEGVVWAYALTSDNAENASLDGTTFTAQSAGEYKVTYTAAYKGRTYTGTLTVTVTDYKVQADMPEGTLTTGTEITLGNGTLYGKGDTPVSEGVEWSYTVTYRDGDLYEDLFGEITVSDKKFTPEMAGEYTILYTATYNGKQYTAEYTVTVDRTAAEKGEVESFNDAASLGNVRLESGADYAEDYLTSESENDSAKLPAGAQYGVSFTVTDGDENGNWPNLHFDAVRMTADAIKEYDYVVIPMYIGVKEASSVTEVQIEVSGSRVFVKTNTWVNVILDAAYFADKGSDSILWIQNGGDDVVNQVNEVRIAGVYAEHADSPSLLDMNTVGAFTGTNAWADSGLSADTTTTDQYTDRSLAPEGMPADSQRVIKLTDDSGTQFAEGYKNGNFQIRPTMTIEELRAAYSEGYRSVVVDLYIEATGTDKVQITWIPEYQQAKTWVPVGKWFQQTLDLAQVIEQLNKDTSDSRINLLKVESVEATPVQTVWVGGLQLSKNEVVAFDSEGSALNFWASNNAQISYATNFESLNGEVPEGVTGAVKFDAVAGNALQIRMIGGVKGLFEDSAKTIKMRVYIVPVGEQENVNVKLYHAGQSSVSVATGTWTEITLTTNDTSGSDNGIYNVFDWYADGTGTGWLNFDADTIQSIYVAGVWLESPAAD